VNTSLFDLQVTGIDFENESNKICCLYEFNHYKKFSNFPEDVITVCEWILKDKNSRS
jgi:hypothetical protein